MNNSIFLSKSLMAVLFQKFQDVTPRFLIKYYYFLLDPAKLSNLLLLFYINIEEWQTLHIMC